MSNNWGDSKRRKTKLMKLYGKRCAYCHNAFSRRALTEDHVIPKCLGSGKLGNIVLSCEPCNKDKADKFLSIANLQQMEKDYPHLLINWQIVRQSYESEVPPLVYIPRRLLPLHHQDSMFSQPVDSMSAG